MNFKDMNAVVEEFQKRDNYMITSHVRPEGDSIGSQIAVLLLLEHLGKKAVVVDQDEVPENLRFLGASERVQLDMPQGFVPDTAVLLDCPVQERVGNVAKYINDNLFVINIDHHISNEYYGDVNWVEPEMSSVGEMVFHLIKGIGLDISGDVAKAIYTAIITDTGMFNYDNTTGGTHEVAGQLIRAGIKPRAMHSDIFEKKPLSHIKMLGKVLMTVQTEEEGLLAHISLTRRMLEEEGVDNVSTEEFINYPRSIRGVEVAVFFNEGAADREAINVSFRSNGKVDVNLIASRLGGGGHKKASGCLVGCGMEEAKKIILEEAVKEIRSALRS